MRCYIVKIPGCVRLASTGGEARAYRQAFVDERGVMKKKVELRPFDIKTAKPDLLAFINILLEQQDDNVDFVLPGSDQEGEGDGAYRQAFVLPGSDQEGEGDDGAEED